MAGVRGRLVGVIWLALRDLAASGAVTSTYQYKVNSGASAMLRRAPATATLAGPRHLVTNVAVPSLTAGAVGVYFLPDRVLFRNGTAFADLPYQALRITVEHRRFIESGTPPHDAMVVDTTWQYVNVRGGPDRRYKNNARRPVLLYGRLILQSANGLNLVWDASQTAPMDAIARALS